MWKCKIGVWRGDGINERCMGSVRLAYGEVIGLTRCRGSVSLAYGLMDVGNGLVWIPIPWKVRIMMWQLGKMAKQLGGENLRERETQFHVSST